MHTISIRIEEELDESAMHALQTKLRDIGPISDVEVHRNSPRDMLVEFEETRISPMSILRELGRHGVHGDIIGA